MSMLAEVRKLMVCRIFRGVQGATTVERVPCIVGGHFASNPERINDKVCGRMLNVKRNGLVLGVMVAGIALLLWAGWHNLREGRLAMQRAQENHIVLMPEKAGSAASADSQSPEAEAMQMRGKAAPAFTLTTLDGKKVSLSDYKGRPVLVNFWATWCAPCKVEMPWFEEFNKQYAAQGLAILGLADDVDAGKDTIAKVAHRTGVTYPILLTDGKVQKAYAPEGMDYLPMSFYVDRNGVIVEETAGLGSKDEIEAHIKKTIASGAAPTAGGQ